MQTFIITYSEYILLSLGVLNYRAKIITINEIDDTIVMVKNKGI